MQQNETLHTCCFFGHRKANADQELRKRLTEIVEKMITKEKVCVFLFGSNSEFDNLCLEIVTKAKEKHPYTKRIYVRAEHQHISENYRKYLLELFDDTYYPKKITNAGRAVYVKRNREMIKNSHFCIVYYNKSLEPTDRKSGTKLALDFAVKLNKNIIYVF